MAFGGQTEPIEETRYLPSYNCVTGAPNAAREQILRVLRDLRG
jgi:hypothetical protein